MATSDPVWEGVSDSNEEGTGRLAHGYGAAPNGVLLLPSFSAGLPCLDQPRGGVVGGAQHQHRERNSDKSLLRQPRRYLGDSLSLIYSPYCHEACDLPPSNPDYLQCDSDEDDGGQGQVVDALAHPNLPALVVTASVLPGCGSWPQAPVVTTGFTFPTPPPTPPTVFVLSTQPHLLGSAPSASMSKCPASSAAWPISPCSIGAAVPDATGSDSTAGFSDRTDADATAPNDDATTCFVLPRLVPVASSGGNPDLSLCPSLCQRGSRTTSNLGATAFASSLEYCTTVTTVPRIAPGGTCASASTTTSSAGMPYYHAAANRAQPSASAPMCQLLGSDGSWRQLQPTYTVCTQPPLLRTSMLAAPCGTPADLTAFLNSAPLAAPPSVPGSRIADWLSANTSSTTTSGRQARGGAVGTAAAAACSSGVDDEDGIAAVVAAVVGHDEFAGLLASCKELLMCGGAGAVHKQQQRQQQQQRPCRQRPLPPSTPALATPGPHAQQAEQEQEEEQAGAARGCRGSRKRQRQPAAATADDTDSEPGEQEASAKIRWNWAAYNEWDRAYLAKHGTNPPQSVAKGTAAHGRACTPCNYRVANACQAFSKWYDANRTKLMSPGGRVPTFDDLKLHRGRFRRDKLKIQEYTNKRRALLRAAAKQQRAASTMMDEGN